MYGAILGDMIGSPYEFDRGNKSKDFPLFCSESTWTDDSVMTVAVADALMKVSNESDERIRTEVIRSMRHWGRLYPDSGYGYRFGQWLQTAQPLPYNSFGNGSAMRVSSAGWLGSTFEQVIELASLTADVTHNHPEGIKGAQATAAGIYLARTGANKDKIRSEISSRFGYDLTRSCDEIRPFYHHDESCQRTVPEAFTAFLEGNSFEDCIRTAVSLGGDCDTLAAITGSLAEAFYGIPDTLIEECHKRLPEDMATVADKFYESVRTAN